MATPQTRDELVANYRYCRSWGMSATPAMACARRGDRAGPYLWWRRKRLAEAHPRRVALNAAGLESIEAIAECHGVSAREYLEALMHYAISTHERPGSWEGAGAFDFDNYRPDGYADKWF